MWRLLAHEAASVRCPGEREQDSEGLVPGDGLAVLTLTPRWPLVHAPPGGAGLSALVSRVRGGLRRSR